MTQNQAGLAVKKALLQLANTAGCFNSIHLAAFKAYFTHSNQVHFQTFLHQSSLLDYSMRKDS